MSTNELKEKQEDITNNIINNTGINTNVNSKDFKLLELKNKLGRRKNLIVKDINDKFHQALIQKRNLDYTCPKEQDNEFFKSHCIGMTLSIPLRGNNVTNLMYKEKENLSLLNLMIGDQVIIELDNEKSYEGTFYILPYFPTGISDVDRKSPGYACVLGKEKDVAFGFTYVIYFHDKPSKKMGDKFTSTLFVPDHLSNVRKDIVSVKIIKRADNNNVSTYLKNGDVYEEDGKISSNSDKIKKHVKDNLESILSYRINFKLLDQEEKEEILGMYNDNSMKVKTSVDDVNNKLKEIYENVSPSARTVNYTWPDGIARAPIRDIKSAKTTMLQKERVHERAKDRMNRGIDPWGVYSAARHDYLDSIINFYKTVKELIDNGNLNKENAMLQKEAKDNLYQAESKISMVINNKIIKMDPNTGRAREELNKAKESLEKLENKGKTMSVGQNEQEKANKSYINALKIYKEEARKQTEVRSDLDGWFPLTEATFLEEDSKDLMNDTLTVKEDDGDNNPFSVSPSLIDDGDNNQLEEDLEEKDPGGGVNNPPSVSPSLTDDKSRGEAEARKKKVVDGDKNPFNFDKLKQEGGKREVAVEDVVIGGRKYTKKNKSKKTNTRKQYKQIKQLKKVLKQSKKQYKKQIKQSKKH